MPHSALNLPLPGVEFAAMTKQASCGPSEVANMPAPHGHHVDIIFDGMHSSNMPPGLPFSWEVVWYNLMLSSRIHSPVPSSR